MYIIVTRLLIIVLEDKTKILTYSLTEIKF